MIKTALKTATIALVIVAGTAGAAFAKTAWADGDSAVRKGATKFHKVVNYIDDGQKVKVEFCKDNKFGVEWCKISIPGKDGYVRRSDLDFKKPKGWGKDFDGTFEMCLGDKNFSFCVEAD